MAMAIVKSSMPICPSNRHCSNWARTYLKFCLCSVNDRASLTLGVISVLSWGVAEIPQIITNYKERSSEGLSVAFLATWILGDLFNLFGCMLEPATLPTQFYMALLYTMTTTILSAQTIYYGHIYPRWKLKRQPHRSSQSEQTKEAAKGRKSNDDVGVKQVYPTDTLKTESHTFGRANILSSPIPLPEVPQSFSPGRELYYMSARSLSRSHTPTAGSVLAQRMITPALFRSLNSIEEPLLDEHLFTQSVPAKNIKTTLCLVPAIMFLGIVSVYDSTYSRHSMVSDKPNQGFVMQVGRKLLQVGGGLLQESHIEKSTGVGTFLGWGMAAIYMGGRLPQIWLNIRRGTVEGLNPFMFIFALVGNSTYVASILVKSLDWSSIRPNLPWLVDAGGCVILDSFILLQFLYFRYWSPQVAVENKHGNSDSA